MSILSKYKIDAYRNHVSFPNVSSDCSKLESTMNGSNGDRVTISSTTRKVL